MPSDDVAKGHRILRNGEGAYFHTEENKIRLTATPCTTRCLLMVPTLKRGTRQGVIELGGCLQGTRIRRSRKAIVIANRPWRGVKEDHLYIRSHSGSTMRGIKTFRQVPGFP